ncbi:uncharacterized protein LOC129885050 [Solanum dulcamara]|uniref:uncharacterized protein LOC129885050 n=1 Tax=Solanum dulcamara TaxID=45834 RepID=UPI00248542EC|nr:uncharacterized protein LOC129885050 [Solanum dulcamara]
MGKIAFSKLIKGMRQEFSNAKQMYRLGGMPYTLNAWIYECASQVPSEIAVRVGNKILRILNWRVVAVKPKFETFMSTIFSEFLIQQKPEASTSTTKVNFRKPHEVPEVEDFSTTPPTELLKRSSHVADTSSPPPSKRMKTSPIKEPIQVETANMHKDFIPPNESEKPVSSDNVPAAKSAIGGESFSHSDQIMHMQFKALKKSIMKSLKRYVDRKFKCLENKINSNHIDLLKAIDSMANRMTGTSSQLKTDDFDQTFHVVEQQQAPTGLEVHNFANKFDPPQQNDQSNIQEDIKVDNILEQNISSDVPELFDQQVSSDTLKEDEPSVKIQKVDDVSEHNIVADDEPKTLIFTPQLKDVSAHQMEPQRAYTDQLIPDSDTLQGNNTGKKDGRVAVDKIDKVEEQVEEIEKEKIKPSTSESNTSAPFSTETLDVIDTLIYGLSLPAMPLTVVSHEQVVQDECLLRDSQLPTTLSSKPNVLSDNAKTPFRRSRISSKILQSPYLSNFRSSEKGEEKLSSVIHQAHPFEGFGICYHPPSELFTDYFQWIDKELLKSHGNKKPKEDHYRSKCSSFGFEKMDFVVAFPEDKNWNFYWVLAVVVLKKRLIRVYDSSPRRRSSNPSLEIQKITAMLPIYLQDSGFFDNNKRTNWSSLDSYKDKSTGNMLEPHHPFAVEYDCGVFLAIFAEYLSDEIYIPNTGLNAEFFRSRYAALLWRYDCQKAMDGYVSDNDDPKKPRRDISPSQGELIDVQ